jgi:LPS export ABC transporter protein LptC
MYGVKTSLGILTCRRLFALCSTISTAGFLSLGGCREDLPKRADLLYTTEDAAVEIARGVEILYSDSAVLRVRVKAPVLHNYLDTEDPRQEFPEGVQIDFFTPGLRINSVLTARFAVRRPEKGLITARDSVVLITADREVLETEELIWDEDKAQLRTDKFVKITRPGEVIYGFGLEATQDFSFWKIIVPKGTIKAEQIDQVLQQ